MDRPRPVRAIVGLGGRRRRCAGWLLALVAGGCAPPAGGREGGGAPALYVASGAEGTIARLDAATGRPLGPPLPAGAAPGQLVPGPGGRVLVRSIGGARQRALTLVAPAGASWVARPVHLEPGADAARLAGAGGPVAVAVYRVPGDPARDEGAPCRLALVDLLRGRIAHTHAFGAAGDVPYGVALEDGPAGPVAHVALWRQRATGGGAGGRLESIHAQTGAVLAGGTLAGVPGQVLLGPSPAGRRPRLYCVEGLGGGAVPDGAGAVAGYADAARWRLLRLDPATLRPEGEYPFGALPRSLTISPDGADAYALAGPDRFRGGGRAAAATTVLHVDLATGAADDLGRVPGPGDGGLAVTAERLYVPDSTDRGVAVLRRRDGLLLDGLRVGLHPLAIALAEPRPG